MPGAPTVDLLAVGSRIKELRGQMLQAEFAKSVDATQGHLSKIERGNIAPSLELLVRLAIRFDVTVDWILRGATKRPPHKR